jgi:hypothetical protein
MRIGIVADPVARGSVVKESGVSALHFVFMVLAVSASVCCDAVLRWTWLSRAVYLYKLLGSRIPSPGEMLLLAWTGGYCCMAFSAHLHPMTMEEGGSCSPWGAAQLPMEMVCLFQVQTVVSHLLPSGRLLVVVGALQRQQNPKSKIQNVVGALDQIVKIPYMYSVPPCEAAKCPASHPIPPAPAQTGRCVQLITPHSTTSIINPSQPHVANLGDSRVYAPRIHQHWSRM